LTYEITPVIDGVCSGGATERAITGDAIALNTIVPNNILTVFGEYEAKTVETSYEAATDGFVLVNASLDWINGTPVGVTCFVKATKLGVYVVRGQQTVGGGTGASGYSSDVCLCMPVKKGFWWKVERTISGVSDCVVTWLPISE